MMRYGPGEASDKVFAARQIAAILERAVAEERAACAAIAEAAGAGSGRQIAAQIRARDNAQAQPAAVALGGKMQAVLVEIAALLRDAV